MKLISGLFFILIVAVTTFANIESRTSILDGNRIHYSVSGNARAKDAVVFVHGWTCSSEFWKDSMAAFPQYRTIAIDLPGHGQSDKPKTAYTMELFARAIENVMKKEGVNRGVLIGHSMGTPVIRQFYRLFPKKTAGLVIVDGALRTYMEKDAFEKFFAPIRGDYAKNAPMFIDPMLAPIKDAELRSWIRERMLATPAHVALGAMDGMGDMKIWETDKIEVPVMAWMAESLAWKPDEEQYFRSIAPKLEWHMHRGVSHFLMMEHPALFNGQVKGFILRNKLLP